MKMETTYQNLGVTAKGVVMGKFIPISTYRKIFVENE
jgi:hypothetical protein